jgi:hypothetical protein
VGAGKPKLGLGHIQDEVGGCHQETAKRWFCQDFPEVGRAWWKMCLHLWWTNGLV